MSSRVRNPPQRINGRKSASWHRSRAWAISRANGRCEAKASPDCIGIAEHVHHMQLRSQNGSDDPSNLLAVCHYCHKHIHDDPEQSRQKGWLR